MTFKKKFSSKTASTGYLATCSVNILGADLLTFKNFASPRTLCPVCVCVRVCVCVVYLF
jgi:hypothetical protein